MENPVMNIQAFGALAVIIGIITTIFWMVVGWRAMRAHEKIADALSAGPSRQRRMSGESVQRDRSKDETSFRDFLDAEPIAKHLDASEQMRRYAEWKRKKLEE
jgi:hypothetical protein